MVAFDADYVRNQFPAFRAPTLRDEVLVDNAGGSYPCRYTVWRLSRFYQERKVPPQASCRAAQLAREEMDEARIRLAALLGIAGDELHFGPSTGANVYVLAQAFREWLHPGSAIVVSEQDSTPNTGPLRLLADAGIEIRVWRADPATGILDPAGLDRILDGRVRLVCFPHVSTLLGHVNDARTICALVRGAGALSCVDGDGFAPHGLPDLRTLGADIYLFSGEMAFGPHQGLMAMRRELAHRLPVQVRDRDAADPTTRFNPAGADPAQIAACAGIADYFDALYDHHFKAGRDARGRAAKVAELIRAREHELLAPLADYLVTRPELRVLGGVRSGAARMPILSLVLEEPAIKAVRRLARHAVITGGGDFSVPGLLRAMGVDPARGVLRLSLLHYALPQEVDRLIAALDTEI
ncbi:selenocysteine lyase/cysteine desulfurase [Rhodovulum bhavnagarense]|uniref:Selenocysteine lyase/cysteine desulfurase n=1 Tax=Rhodovulum bhavnagarense TaxID=992286 RepID=A0A4R2RB82_9RHOB|nr:aminotransferase class V-fold PLP-dependent enzyme [Rhodovulum bhavnagarense]TCP60582.1 selenocysteine lyase/cysteine desulfurase [Rhodovulum bhavnagarense]